MRIAGAIIALPLALIILVQSLAAGAANAIDEASGATGHQDGSVGFFVAVLFFVGSALMFGRVMKAAAVVWGIAGITAVAGAASGGYFKDLYAWGIVAFVYMLGVVIGLRKQRANSNQVEAVTPALPETKQAA